MDFSSINLSSLLQEEIGKIKNGTLFSFYPSFLGKTLALFHKVRNSYYTITATEWPEASVYNDGGNFTSPDRNK